MNKQIKIISVCFAILICIPVLICSGTLCFADDSKTYEQIRTKIKIGQSKQTVREMLGPPDKIIDSGKSNKYIWGPEEEFWDKIPMGAKMEVWRYAFSDGGLNLYFIDGSEKLDHIAFAPKGVVY
ncbi:MAG: hypothetical protein A2X59_08585 [Nitrospirae bacterium GWC2_42_7]|nr:MAG: hypothetical protein A2X59_08585 [Nitrospirae bacterium GWC2_42_7]